MGQLGVNLSTTGIDKWDVEDHRTPTLCRQLKTIQITKIACGERHTLALTSQGLLYSFGDGSQGALGLDQSILQRSSSRIAVPTLINTLNPAPVVDIACGSNHSLCVLSTGAYLHTDIHTYMHTYSYKHIFIYTYTILYTHCHIHIRINIYTSYHVHPLTL